MPSNTQQPDPVIRQSLVTPHHIELKADHVIPPAKTEKCLSKLSIKDETIDETQRRHYLFQPPPPMSHAASFHNYPHEAPVRTDLAKYLVRREMVTSGQLKFDNHPENYWAWKSSFLDITKGLHLSAREVLDLLIKCLGPQSASKRFGSDQLMSTVL